MAKNPRRCQLQMQPPPGRRPRCRNHSGSRKEKGTQLIIAKKNLTTLVAMLSDVAGAGAPQPRPLFFPLNDTPSGERFEVRGDKILPRRR
jgi:hypothetical protein